MRISGKNLSYNQKTVLAVAAVAALCALVWLRSPLVYEAHTTILIVPGQPPESTAALTDAASRVELIRQVVLSDTRLERVINQDHLYQDMIGHSSKERNPDAFSRIDQH